MPWWGILDVDKDADLRAIKRAYAAKLKTIRQDENPAEFMALREAYETAQSYYKYKSDPIEEIVVIEGIENISESTGPQFDQPQSPPSIMDDVVKLMKSPWGGNSIDAWQAVFDDERLEAIDDFSDFEHGLLVYLLDLHNAFDEEENETKLKSKLSQDVANLIFSHFNWYKARANSYHIDLLATHLQLHAKGDVTADWFSQSQVEKRKYDNVLQDLTDSNDSGWHELVWPAIIIFSLFVLAFLTLIYLGKNPLLSSSLQSYLENTYFS